ncbi:MAG: B12-binding domain-containing radical SAM protein [Chloroflexi bacterium]|nr:B12-binding domain-containing radical SAM protein [Chloroflexota bacterium]
MRAPTRVLLVSTYELGHQPLGLAAPAASLRAAGHEVRTLDVAVAPAEQERFDDVDLVAISVPMHTAARLGVTLAAGLRRARPRLPIAFYGLYASPLRERLLADGLADAVIGGEVEPALVALADRLAAGGWASDECSATPAFPRQAYPVPDRHGLPPLDRYARLRVGDELRLAGYVEASRGCAHRCAHCPLTPVYGGRLRLVQQASVLADVDQLVAAGAEHVTFGDPDFLNAVPHSLATAEALHARHPRLTFDVTVKVEHLVERPDAVARLREAGCLFVTSAFESTSDRVLDALEKGHSAGDLDRALAVARAAGVALRPTWVTFTPWTTAGDLLAQLDFIERRGLVAHVQPVQYAIRLLLPPGSPLVSRLRDERRLGRFDEDALTFTWASADPRLEALQGELAGLVEGAACGAHDVEPAVETFRRVKAAARRHLLGDPRPVDVLPQPREAVPGLTEPWFC